MDTSRGGAGVQHRVRDQLAGHQRGRGDLVAVPPVGAGGSDELAGSAHGLRFGCHHRPDGGGHGAGDQVAPDLLPGVRDREILPLQRRGQPITKAPVGTDQPDRDPRPLPDLGSDRSQERDRAGLDWAADAGQVTQHGCGGLHPLRQHGVPRQPGHRGQRPAHVQEADVAEVMHGHRGDCRRRRCD